MCLLLLLARRKGVNFEAYYDDDSFCGFSYVVENDDLVFILYLAVNDEIRSRGYGSRILEYVKAKAGERPIVLDIEPLDPNAENYEQRKRRLAFYEKNGYFNTGLILRESKEKYSILATVEDLDAKKLGELLRGFSFGLSKMRIEQGFS